MPVESEADRAVFVNPDEFGVTVRYQAEGQAARDIAGVFDDPSREAFAGDIGVSTPASPRVTIRAADLPEGAAPGENTGDRVTIAGVAYEPRAAEPDGTGMLVLVLEEVE